MSNLNSASIRALIAKCEAEVAETGKRLTAADTAYKAAVRAALLNGTPDAPAQANALAATQEHHRATDRLQTARQLLTEALAAEKAAAEAQTRTAIHAIATEMQDAASKADSLFSAFVEAVERLRQLEHAARLRCSQGLNQQVYGGVIVPTAYGDAVSHLTATRNGNADSLTPLVAEKVTLAVRRIHDATGA